MWGERCGVKEESGPAVDVVIVHGEMPGWARGGV